MIPETFIARWHHADGSELASAQSFTRELCELLDVPIPDPARADTAENAYVFERRITFRHGDGSVSEGRPPFLIVMDVGNVIELYAEFSRSGATYTPYPDPRSHRLSLAALNAARAAEEAQGRIRWLRPEFQDPSAPRSPDAAQRNPGLLPEDEVEEEAMAAPDSGAGAPASRLRPAERLPQLLETLAALGRARRVGEDGAYTGA